jgi:hypothetical protein
MTKIGAEGFDQGAIHSRSTQATAATHRTPAAHSPTNQAS